MLSPIHQWISRRIDQTWQWKTGKSLVNGGLCGDFPANHAWPERKLMWGVFRVETPGAFWWVPEVSQGRGQKTGLGSPPPKEKHGASAGRFNLFIHAAGGRWEFLEAGSCVDMELRAVFFLVAKVGDWTWLWQGGFNLMLHFSNTNLRQWMKETGHVLVAVGNAMILDGFERIAHRIHLWGKWISIAPQSYCPVLLYPYSGVGSIRHFMSQPRMGHS